MVTDTVSTSADLELTHPITSADEEAVNKVAEKIDTLRLGPRQVKSNDGLNLAETNILPSIGTRSGGTEQRKHDSDSRRRSTRPRRRDCTGEDCQHPATDCTNPIRDHRAKILGRQCAVKFICCVSSRILLSHQISLLETQIFT